MPGFAYRLDDTEVAELASFLRNAWSNRATAVSADQAREVRATPGKATGEVAKTVSSTGR